MLDNPRVSTTQRQIEELHAHQRKTDISLDAHIAFLLTLGRFTLLTLVSAKNVTLKTITSSSVTLLTLIECQILEMYGVSDHDLLFSKEAEPTEDHELVEGDPKKHREQGMSTELHCVCMCHMHLVVSRPVVQASDSTLTFLPF